MKKSKKEDLGNYKLLQYTPVPGRFMEQMLLEAISKHMKCKRLGTTNMNLFIIMADQPVCQTCG